MLHSLDDIDIRILQLLQRNARLTNKEIGERLNKSATSIYGRVTRLQEYGYITGYVAILDHKKVGLGLVSFTQIQVKEHLHENLSTFIEEIIKFEEVLECYQMSGEYDFILRIAVKDLAAYHDFLMNKVFKIVHLGSVQSSFVLNEAKKETGFPISSPSGYPIKRM